MGKGKKINFSPTPSSQKKIKSDIIQCFSQFWNNSKLSIAEKNRSELNEYIEECAEIAAMIKEYLESHQRGPAKIYQGNGREVLWNLEEFPKDKKTFCKTLIHALFNDGKVYTSKLTKNELDHLIHEADEYLIKRNTNNLNSIKSLENEVRESWTATSKLLEEIFKKIDENPLASPTYANQLNKLSNSLGSIQYLVKKFHKVTVEIKEKSDDETSLNSAKTSETNSSVPTPSTTPEAIPEATSETTPEATSETTPELQEEVNPEHLTGKIIVKQIAEEVHHITEELKSLSENLSHLGKEEIVTNPQEAMKMIDSLHKSCIGYSESLMKDLFKLDELSLAQEDRPKRKEQVQKIQQLTSDIDSFTQRVHELIMEIKSEEELHKNDQPLNVQESKEQERREKEERVKKEKELVDSFRKEQEEREKEREAYLTQLALKRRHIEEEKERERVSREIDLQKQRESFEKQLTAQAEKLYPIFKKMKLKVKFEVEQAPNAYFLSCHVPGMNSGDIEISSSKQGPNNILNIKGFRGPTFEELAIMRRQLARMGLEDDDESLLRICIGRFGTFTERYSLPLDADIQGISADYKSGELSIAIPRIKRSIPSVIRPSMYDNPEFWW